MSSVPGTLGSQSEEHLAQWRRHVRRQRAIGDADVEELEDHLRSQIASLQSAGLNPDEAFLIAVKRLGAVDELSQEFAAEHSERLWKQLVLGSGPHRPALPDSTSGPGSAGVPNPPEDLGEPDRRGSLHSSAHRNRSSGDLPAVLGLALAAAAAVKVPTLFGLDLGPDGNVYARNLGLLVLPFLALLLARRRGLGAALTARLLLPPFVLAALLVNTYPFEVGGSTEVLTVVHLPVLLWLCLAPVYAAGRWRSHPRRMDFLRFTGEWVVYYTLLALGGAVLMGLTAAGFTALDLDAETALVEWVLPCGAAGAVVVAAWLVEAKQSVVENMAPVLTRVFTPLTALMLLAFLVASVTAGGGVDVDRDLLILVDLVLVLVLGLLLYAVSARDPHSPPDAFDRVQLLVVVTALVLDLLMLGAMLTRIAAFGPSPNKVAALGLNLVLLINLAYSAWLGVAFLRRRRPLAALERWQTAYLPVYAVWAAVVVALFPPVFGFR